MPRHMCFSSLTNPETLKRVWAAQTEREALRTQKWRKRKNGDFTSWHNTMPNNNALPAGIEHIGHEGHWVSTSRCVHYINDNRWKRGCQGLGDNCPRSWPCEYLNLSRCVNQDIPVSKKIIKEVLLLHSERYSRPQNINIWAFKTRNNLPCQVSYLPIAIKVKTTFPLALVSVQYSGSMARAAIHQCCKQSQRKLIVFEIHCIKNER